MKIMQNMPLLRTQFLRRRVAALSGTRVCMSISFEIIGDISEIETIVIDKSIREISRLRKSYGSGRWRKMKGKATIRLPDGIICKAELYWYEAHGIGRKDIKIKKIFW
jgi:hypothetical protein